MRILLAAADRDLLQSYGELLRADFGETFCAFDGTQLLRLLEEEVPELVILDRDLPRVDARELLRLLRTRGIPSLLLTGEPITARLLAEEPSPWAYLGYPFLPESLFRLIRELTEKRNRADSLPFGEWELRYGDFGGPGFSLTDRELEVLEKLRDGRRIDPDAEGAAAGALNLRLARLGSGYRIKYLPEDGCRMVKEHE